MKYFAEYCVTKTTEKQIVFWSSIQLNYFYLLFSVFELL